MVIYADVLVFTNTVVNFLLISLTKIIIRSHQKTWKEIAAAFVSACFSLYIFLPDQSFFVELMMRITSSATAVIIAFGFNNLKIFMRSLAVFYVSSFLFAGIMLGIRMFSDVSGLAVNNGVVYFNISPLILITTSFVIYCAVLIIRKITAKSAELAERYKCKLCFNSKCVCAEAIIDTGHSMQDVFGSGLVIFIDRKTANEIFGKDETAELLLLKPPEKDVFIRNFRMMPAQTVSGENLMPAVKIDKLLIGNEGQFSEIIKPIAVISDSRLGDDFSVILPPEAVTN